MKKVLKLLLILILFSSCNEPALLKTRTEEKITPEKIVDTLSYEQIKNLLYLKEKTMDFVTYSYSSWKPLFGSNLKVEVKISNNSLVTAYRDFKISINYLTDDGYPVGQKEETINMIVYPQQTETYTMTIYNYPSSTKHVKVKLLSYSSANADSLTKSVYYGDEQK